MPRLSSRRAAGPRCLLLEQLETRMALHGSPILSEILALNDDVLDDADGDASDWIEIHHPGPDAANLDGWYLTDDPQNLAKWQFPATTIPPGGYLTVFASGKNRRQPGHELHTNFSLNGDGEFLALVRPDGATIASQFAPAFPKQFEDISYGLGSTQTVTTLVGPSQTAAFVVPDADFDAQHGNAWNGGSEPFDDSAAGWTHGPLGLGYDANREFRPPGIDGTIAYQIPRGTPGDQAASASLGMDFVVTRPITITSLGAFDDRSNGFQRTITVQLWARDDGGTPGNFADDLGSQVLASATFSSTSGGSLIGGSRFKALASPLTLQPGAYSIVASGYGTTERNGVATGGAGFGQLGLSDALQYVGGSRFNTGTTTGFPRFVDLGPANRYGAGTFTFIDPAAPPTPAVDGAVIALQSTPGAGESNFGGVLGMDFVVNRPIRVTEPGVFDSGQDGIAGTLAVSLWSRSGNTGALLADRTFVGNAGQIAAGTGSRFLPLDQPLTLLPGTYTVVANGFLGDDKFSSYDDANPRVGSIHTGNDAIALVNASRWALDPEVFYSTYRQFERPFHAFPDRPDSGPANRYAAGTFRFQPLGDALTETDASPMFNVNASTYVRVPFDVANDAAYEGLRLTLNYDDGAVVYLNGVEVLRRNAPATLAFNSAALVARPVNDPFTAETFDLSPHLTLLHPGRNILAIHALNASASDLDLLLVPRLEAIDVSPPTELFFPTPTPGAANNAGVFGKVLDTTFDKDRGFVDAQNLDDQGRLVVHIATPTPGAQIYYTTDGTVPSPTHGTLYVDGVTITRTTTLRARAFKDGFLPTDVDTQTYLFAADILGLAGPPPGYPTHWNAFPADYAMSQNPTDLADIVGVDNATSEELRAAIEQSLRSLPTISIVMDPEDLFGPARGLYTNSFARTDDWEKPASIEYILPDGTTGFQIDAGLQMQGWTSRIPAVTPKHSLKISFREEYGAGKLNYQLFPDSPVDSFDILSLRANNRDTWISDYRVVNNNVVQFLRPQATYIRDEWAKDTLNALGQPAPHGNFVHVYLNGIYWGVYNPTERPDADFAASYFGGSEADYDVMRFCNPAPEIVDGQRDKWDALLAAKNAGFATLDAYMRVQGRNPDGTRNPAFDNLLDVDSLIDFMILGHYHAGDDWPCNFYAIRHRGPDSQGFKFTAWDDDLALPFADVNASTVEPNSFCFNIPANQQAGCQTLYSRTPGAIDAALRANPEYRLRFADHIQKHLFHGGPLSVDKNIERWQTAAQEIQPGLIAEAVRWGDYRRDVDPLGDPFLYTPGDEWASIIDLMTNSFFPNREAVVLSQWRAAGLFPHLDAPQFSQRGGQILAGETIELSSTAGTIYYTLDGTDPRAIGGAISPTAFAYAAPITLDRSQTIRARAFDGNQWSALDEALFTVDTPLRVTELFYNPAGASENTEFIELRNIGTVPLDLTGITFTRDEFGAGVDYQFLPTDTNLTLPPGAYLVVAHNRDAFIAAYPNVPLERIADRQFAGNLGNGGDTLTIRDRFGGLIQSFTYDDAWRPDTDGGGRSLVIVDPTADKTTWNDPASWRSSFEDGGSPGADDVMRGDINRDQLVGLADLLELAMALASPPPESTRYDVNQDGTLNRGDLAALIVSLGRASTPPTATDATPSHAATVSTTPHALKPLASAPYSPHVVASTVPRANWTSSSISTLAPLDTGYQAATANGPAAATPSPVAPAAAIDVAVVPSVVENESHASGDGAPCSANSPSTATFSKAPSAIFAVDDASLLAGSSPKRGYAVRRAALVDFVLEAVEALPQR